jgi:hypothetical protein
MSPNGYLADNYTRFRAFRPQYFLPTILYGIFINVTGTYGTQFATMAEAEALGKYLKSQFWLLLQYTNYTFSQSIAYFRLSFPVSAFQLQSICLFSHLAPEPLP